jgi:hypothetical protein
LQWEESAYRGMRIPSRLTEILHSIQPFYVGEWNLNNNCACSMGVVSLDVKLKKPPTRYASRPFSSTKQRRLCTMDLECCLFCIHYITSRRIILSHNPEHCAAQSTSRHVYHRTAALFRRCSMLQPDSVIDGICEA